MSKSEELLQKIVDNTNPKSSFHILVSGSDSIIKTKFLTTLTLDGSKQYEMALVGLETYYSFPNIDKTNNHFRYSPDNGTSWFSILIPEGCYEIQDISAYINRIMKDNRHIPINIKPNNNTLRCIIAQSRNYFIDFTPPDSIRTVLGFERKVYRASYFESENIVNIISINSLRVTSDIIGASYSNGSAKSIIYSFFPNVGPGFKIIQEPKNLVYLPITLYKIDRMETTLTDQNDKPVNLRGEELSIRFHVREK